MGCLHLRRFEALPLRTYRDGDFQQADPILAVLGGFGRVAEGEILLSQLVLKPASDDWADGFQSLTRPPDVRVKTESPLGWAGEWCWRPGSAWAWRPCCGFSPGP